jgi:hypothetical protein
MGNIEKHILNSLKASIGDGNILQRHADVARAGGKILVAAHRGSECHGPGKEGWEQAG